VALMLLAVAGLGVLANLTHHLKLFLWILVATFSLAVVVFTVVGMMEEIALRCQICGRDHLQETAEALEEFADAGF
jgi:hypothetical protein